MKYAELNEYKKYLEKTHGLSRSTVKTYYNCLDRILKGQIMLETIDFEKVIDQLSKF